MNEIFSKKQLKSINKNSWRLGAEIEADWGSKRNMEYFVDKYEGLIARYYHDPETEPYKGKKYIFEPDNSIEGSYPMEMVTPVLSYIELEKVFTEVFPHIQTNHTMGLHINMSNIDFKIADIDWFKFLLFFEEGYVFNKFKSRIGNFNNTSIQYLLNGVMSEKEYIKIVQTKDYNNLIKQSNKLIINYIAKRYGVNLVKNQFGYVEFRYIGGDEYHKMLDDILLVINMYMYTFEQVISNKNAVEYINKINRINILPEFNFILSNEIEESPFAWSDILNQLDLTYTINKFVKENEQWLIDNYKDTDFKATIQQRRLWIDFSLRTSSEELFFNKGVTLFDIKQMLQEDRTIINILNIVLNFKIQVVLNKLKLSDVESSKILISNKSKFEDMCLRIYKTDVLRDLTIFDKYINLLISKTKELINNK